MLRLCLSHLLPLMCTSLSTSRDWGVPIDGHIASFIAEDLEVSAQNRTNITLTDLNHSIGKALAAMYWYGQYLPGSH